MGQFCQYGCCDSAMEWPDYLERKGNKKEGTNFGMIRVRLPHAKEEFLNDVPWGTPELFKESFMRSGLRPWIKDKAERFQQNNENHSARYVFDSILQITFVVEWQGFESIKEYVNGRVIEYHWILKTAYYDSNLLKLKNKI